MGQIRSGMMERGGVYLVCCDYGSGFGGKILGLVESGDEVHVCVNDQGHCDCASLYSGTIVTEFLVGLPECFTWLRCSTYVRDNCKRGRVKVGVCIVARSSWHGRNQYGRCT